MKNEKTIEFGEAEWAAEGEDPTKWDYLGLGKNWGWNC